MQCSRVSLQYGLLLAACLAGGVGLAEDSADRAGKPLYGAWGFDTAGADFATRPGDDFFRYANGAWLDRATIPADKSARTLRLEMTDRTEARLHGILEQAAADVPREPATLAGKAGAFYRSFMDEARIERLGAAPLAPELAAVREARTRDELATLMGRSTVDFEPTLFATFIDVDLKDPTRYALYLSQSGLGLPDRDYYLKPEFASTRAAYQAHVARLLRLLGWPAADARAGDVVEFETRIAEVSWSKVQQRDLLALYNPMTIARAAAAHPRLCVEGDFSTVPGSARSAASSSARRVRFRSLPRCMQRRRSMRSAPGRRSTSRTTRRPTCRSRSPTPGSSCTSRRCPASGNSACAGSARSPRSAVAISWSATVSAPSARWDSASVSSTARSTSGRRRSRRSRRWSRT